MTFETNVWLPGYPNQDSLIKFSITTGRSPFMVVLLQDIAARCVISMLSENELHVTFYLTNALYPDNQRDCQQVLQQGISLIMVLYFKCLVWKVHCQCLIFLCVSIGCNTVQY